ncbi:hypothetical protein HNV10_06395 [Winogradskyella litoriviva]|uniref:TonB C-terminal domain-containing protein n=1 Tax=Winogradskyella litoriviva TaxID=1220182 RepID=A0ABX2E3N6_9FLAO|nr:hypothetical protein [Winogradskyella litoriviva]NRD22862.1 hypothetical protein [Winogradskyella litoriviva]
MKKRIIILGTTLTILSVLFFGFTKLTINNPETLTTVATNEAVMENNVYVGPYLNPLPNLYYGVDARFAPVKKADVLNAKSIYDFLNEGEKDQIITIKSVNLTVIKDNQLSELQALGTTAKLTKAQIKLLKSMDYFNHFTIRTEFRGKNMETGIIEDKFFGPHITIVPNQQAAYSEGKEALLNYFKDNSRNVMNIITDNKINALKISFIINKEGKVTNVKHDAMSTGYPKIDAKFMELVKNIPGQWIPAQNANGEKMNQELVFTFGPTDGC